MTYPLGLQLRGRKVLVVGGGPVAARRLQALLDDGALVTVIAPYACEDITDAAAAGRVDWQQREYRNARGKAFAPIQDTGAFPCG